MIIKNGLRFIRKWPNKLSIPKTWKQIRGCAPIRMMEYWKIGKMGRGILKYWVNGKLRLDAKVLNGLYPLKPIIPSFRYSIIP
jgi:hypothetical protein